MSTKRVWSALTAGLLAAGLASAQEREPLSLAEARRSALARNFELLAAETDVALAEAQGATARERPNPQLGISVSKLNGGSGRPGSDPTRDTVIAASQLVEVGGKRGARIRSAEAGAVSARERLASARRRQDAAVIKAYAAAVVAAETARLDRLSAGSLGRTAEIAALRLRAGEISKAESEQVEIAAGRFEADTRAAEAAAVQARIALELLLGRARPDGSLTLADGLDVVSAAAQGVAARPLEPDAIARLADERPDVRAVAARVDQARADRKLQRALRLPDPTLSAQYESDLPDNPRTFGFSVSLPVPVWSRNRGGVLAADAALTQAERDLEQARARAVSEIAAAREAFEAARARRARLQDELLPRASHVQQTVAFSYERGGASLLELLEAERNLNDLRLAGLAAAADAIAAAADLAAALGESLP